jgi:hypothetical protein
MSMKPWLAAFGFQKSYTIEARLEGAAILSDRLHRVAEWQQEDSAQLKH